MAKLIRVDAELVRRGLAKSRTEASELIQAGAVFLDGVEVNKPARQMNPAQALMVKKAVGDNWVSRGAYKLLGALDYLAENYPGGAPEISGMRALDAGASTGGFTEVLLRRGAASVVAVDVGYGQLAWKLREDPRVEVLERTNVRTMQSELVAPAPNLVVGDLSFISLTLVLPALVAASAPDAKFLLMVKPQFEVGKTALGTGGVVKEPELHFLAVRKVARAARNLGLQVLAAAPSPLPGPAGNVEYFLYLAKGNMESVDNHNYFEQMIIDAIKMGPVAQELDLAKQETWEQKWPSVDANEDEE
ncbi:MAG: TlyA family RNA methyltransferase [Arcanobacterium sp.]|nr:TlyA family RNA methyltransferase [Arcanobacterium sp.]